VPIAYSQWAGLFAPAGINLDVLKSLGEAARFAAQDPRATQSVTASGSAMQFLDATEFGRFVQADARTMAVVVQRIGRVE
jgi:tripartite-type tricarboxylate transporter receptor subunit TctC